MDITRYFSWFMFYIQASPVYPKMFGNQPVVQSHISGLDELAWNIHLSWIVAAVCIFVTGSVIIDMIHKLFPETQTNLASQTNMLSSTQNGPLRGVIGCEDTFIKTKKWTDSYGVTHITTTIIDVRGHNFC